MGRPWVGAAAPLFGGREIAHDGPPSPSRRIKRVWRLVACNFLLWSRRTRAEAALASCSFACNSLAKAKLLANCCLSRRASRSVTWVATIVLAENTSCLTDCKILNSGLECLVEAIRRTIDSAACLRRLRMPLRAALSSLRTCSCSRVRMVVLPDLRTLTSEAKDWVN